MISLFPNLEIIFLSNLLEFFSFVVAEVLSEL